MKGQWLTKPDKNVGPFDVDDIEHMVNVWTNIITHAMRSNNIETARKTMDLLRKFRGLGLKKKGEYSTANLVYKTLRNSDLIKNLQNYIDQEHDQGLSLHQ